MNEWAWYAVATIGVTLVLFIIVQLFFRKKDNPRLTASGAGDSNPELLLGDMTDVLSRGLPGSTRDREEVLPDLLRAGVYGASALAEYRAIRAVLILVPLFVAAAVALLVETPQIPWVVGVGIFFAVLGFSLPRVYISMKAQERSREIERGLPVFADMLSIALLAGQGLTMALRRVTDQLRQPFPKMSEELEIVLRQTEMLSLSTAFEQWANRSQLPEVRNLSVILTQSQRLGNDVTTSLMEYATTLRANVRQRADAKAQRASFWMLFPTILCLWIPAVVILAGPLFFEFSARRAKAREDAPNLKDIGKIGPKSLNKNLPIGVPQQ